MHNAADVFASTTDPLSQGLVAATLIMLFVLLTLEKAHRVLVAMAGVAIIWAITYLTPYHLISFENSASHLDLNVLLLLASMMAVVGILKATGVFAWAVDRLMIRAGNSPVKVMTMVVWFTGIASAFLDNVTTVIFVTPIAFGMATQLGIAPVAILLPMVMAANIGGTATLIGDPPNIMIGSGAGITFGDFLTHLTAPVLLMMVVLPLFTAWWYKKELTMVPTAAAGNQRSLASASQILDPRLLRGMGWICGFILVGFLTHGMTHMPAAVPAVIGAAAALVYQDVLYLRNNTPSHEERVHGILGVLEKEIEWPTLVFFSFLFIMVGAAVETGLIATAANSLAGAIEAGRTSLGLGPEGTLLFAALLVLWASGALSAVIDNIPYVAVSIPILHGLIPTLPGEASVLWWALSLGACLGGNATPIGASANVTTLDLSARRGTRIAFREFTRFAIPTASITLVISSAWLALMIFFGYHVALYASLAVAAVLWFATRRRLA